MRLNRRHFLWRIPVYVGDCAQYFQKKISWTNLVLKNEWWFSKRGILQWERMRLGWGCVIKNWEGLTSFPCFEITSLAQFQFREFFLANILKPMLIGEHIWKPIWNMEMLQTLFSLSLKASGFKFKESSTKKKYLSSNHRFCWGKVRWGAQKYNLGWPRRTKSFFGSPQVIFREVLGASGPNDLSHQTWLL